MPFTDINRVPSIEVPSGVLSDATVNERASLRSVATYMGIARCPQFC